MVSTYITGYIEIPGLRELCFVFWSIVVEMSVIIPYASLPIVEGLLLQKSGCLVIGVEASKSEPVASRVP